MTRGQTWIAKQKVISIEQRIEWLEKIQVEHEDELFLYEEKIGSTNFECSLKNIFDISYKWEAGKIGYLYVHTISGVKTFHIKSDPSRFIDLFKQQHHL